MWPPGRRIVINIIGFLGNRFSREFVVFVAVGATNTVFYFLVFNLFRLALASQMANALAVAISVTFSFWANRRFTFRYAGSDRGMRQFAEFAVVFLLTLAISSGALAILFSTRSDVSVVAENIALVVSSGVLVIVRFWIMRNWVFDHDRSAS